MDDMSKLVDAMQENKKEGCHIATLAKPELNYASYFGQHTQTVNIMGFQITAYHLGFDDVARVTSEVGKYIKNQELKLTNINEKFKQIGFAGKVAKRKQEDDGDEEEEDSELVRELKQIIKSQRNNHYVDLLANHTIQVVAENFGLTNEALRRAVEEQEELVFALKEKVKVGKDKGVLVAEVYGQVK